MASVDCQKKEPNDAVESVPAKLWPLILLRKNQEKISGHGLVGNPSACSVCPPLHLWGACVNRMPLEVAVGLQMSGNFTHVLVSRLLRCVQACWNIPRQSVYYGFSYIVETLGTNTGKWTPPI